MYAKELISDIVPTLRLHETGEKALRLMNAFKISHLPVVDDSNNLLGLIADTDINTHDKETTMIKNYRLSLLRAFVFYDQHIYDVISLVARQKLSIIPVLDKDGNYAGVITAYALIAEFGKLTAANHEGSVFSLILNKHDYSLSHISQLIEGNNAKILSLYSKPEKKSNKIKITIKIDQVDISAIRQTFERYEYEIKEIQSKKDKIKEMLDERVDELMYYLDI